MKQVISVVLIVWFVSILAAQQAEGHVRTWGIITSQNLNTDNIAVAAGKYHSLALKTDGHIECWGANTMGTYSWGGDYTGCCEPPDNGPFTAIAAGIAHSLAVRADGSLAAWGLNDTGQCTVPVGNDFVKVAAGDGLSVALRQNGSVIYWGILSGTITDGFCVDIAASSGHGLILKLDGSLAVIGSGFTPPGGNTFVAIGCSSERDFGIRVNGSLQGWNSFGEIDTNTPLENNYVQVTGGGHFGIARKNDGSLVGWIISEGTVFGAQIVPEGNDFLSIAAGDYNGTALKADGSVVNWGDKWYGQSNAPQVDNIVKISANYHMLAVDTDHTIYGWGHNCQGQVTIPEFTWPVMEVSAGYDFSTALFENGMIVCWYRGEGMHVIYYNSAVFRKVIAGDYYGIAGLTSDNSIQSLFGNVLNPVPAGNDFVAISVKYNTALALRSDGSLVAFGMQNSNLFAVPAGNDFTKVSIGLYHALALRNDGSIVAWGSNTDGQCDVSTGNDFIAIAAGYNHSLALHSDGTLEAWGDNSHGQCNIPPGERYLAIDAGYYESAAICIPIEVGEMDDTVLNLIPDIKICPNPFQSTVELVFSAKAAGKASLTIYNAKGQVVRTLAKSYNINKGENSFDWDGLDKSGNPVASGIYFLQSTIAGRTRMDKLLKIK